MILNISCLGRFPTKVCTPTGDIIVILSPISKLKLILRSFPIDISFSFNVLNPKKLSFCKTLSLEKSSDKKPFNKTPLVEFLLSITASPSLLKIMLSISLEIFLVISKSIFSFLS